MSATCRLVTLGALFAIAAAAQTFTFIRVAEGPRPDGRGNFNPGTFNRPAIEGTRIVFPTFQAETSLWSHDLATGSYVRLADTSMAAPGGTGNFTDFSAFDARPLFERRDRRLHGQRRQERNQSRPLFRSRRRRTRRADCQLQLA